MKKINLFLGLMLMLMFFTPSFSQSEEKVIAVVNHADWCPACQKNGERAKAAFMENNKDNAFQFVVNDLTNDETKKKSADELKKYGLDEAMASLKLTGVAYFFNSETKSLISKVNVAKPDTELAEAMKTAKNSVQ